MKIDIGLTLEGYGVGSLDIIIVFGPNLFPFRLLDYL